jgi:hypothetical protein
MGSRRTYQPRPYQPRPSWSRRPAGAWPGHRARPYRPYPSRRRPAGGGFLADLLDALLGRRR